MKPQRYIKLSQTDLIFHSMAEVFPSISMLVTLRFKTFQPEEDIRNAMRYMLTIYPKLRSIMVPTLFSYKLKVFDDTDRQLETLFDQVFRVMRHLDPDSEDYLEMRRQIFNEPLGLTQGLPIRIRYLAYGDMPVLLISIHHLISDGIGFMHMIESLMAYLNGKRPPLNPVDNRSIWPFLLKKPYYRLPLELYKSFRKFRMIEKKLRDNRIVNISSRQVNYFGTSNIKQHLSVHPLKTVLQKSKMLNVSLTTFIMTALVCTIAKKYNQKEDGNTISILTAIGLRQLFETNPPVFGNYVKANLINIDKNLWDNKKSILKEIKYQLNDRIMEVKNKEFMYSWLRERLGLLIGKKNIVRGIVNAKREGKLEFSCQLSTGGNIDKINSHGDKAQVIELIDAVPHHKIFTTLTSLNGRINMNFSYPEADFTRKEIKDFIASFDAELGMLLELDVSS